MQKYKKEGSMSKSDFQKGETRKDGKREREKIFRRKYNAKYQTRFGEEEETPLFPYCHR